MIPTKKRTPRVSWLSPMISNFFDMDKWPAEDYFFKRDLFPAINVVEHTDSYDIEIAIPGFSKKNFTITIDDGVLNISAERKEEIKKETDKIVHKEFTCKSFNRSLYLPDNVAQDNDIKAHYEDGMLKLKLQKIEVEELSKHKVIEVV